MRLHRGARWIKVPVQCQEAQGSTRLKIQLNDSEAPRLGRSMRSAIRGDHAADSLQPFVTGAFRPLTDIAMRDLGGPLLERGIDKSQVGVIPGLRVEAVVDQVMDRGFDGAHVHPTREVEVLVEQVAVPVFLRRPAATPARPGSIACSGGILDALQPVQPRLVRRQSFLGNHVAHQDHQQFVRQRLGALTEVGELARPIPGCHVRQEIGGLPALLGGFEQGIEMLPEKWFHASDDLASQPGEGNMVQVSHTSRLRSLLIQPANWGCTGREAEPGF